MAPNESCAPSAKTRGEKLGIKPGHAVLLDAISCSVESRASLLKLPDLAKRLTRDGALWTIRSKGSPHISELDVLKAGRAAGLVDVKVVRFSDTHTAQKFVVPRKLRIRAGSRVRKGA